MTVIFHDIHEKDRVKEALKESDILGVEFNEDLYADDTILMTKTTEEMETLIKQIEREGGKYGMKLNKSKCEALSDGNSEPIKFMDGESLKQKSRSKIFRLSNQLQNEHSQRSKWKNG